MDGDRLSRWRHGHICNCRTPCTGLSRSPSTAQVRGPTRASSATWLLATTNPSTAPASSTIATSSSFNSRARARWNSIGWHLACPTRTPPTSRGGWAGAAEPDAAGTPGSCHTTRSRVVTGTGRIRRRFRRVCPGVLPPTARAGQGADRRRSVSGPGSTAVACATLGLNFVGRELDEGHRASHSRPGRRGLGRRRSEEDGQAARACPTGLRARATWRTWAPAGA